MRHQKNNNACQFIQFCIQAKVLTFGEFTTKARRISPYFFNAGGFNDGHLLAILAEYYATAITESGIEYDMLFGPAYKGITLVSATAMELSRRSKCPVPFAYNRKETKDHGEGGAVVGAPLQGRILLIDDVISAGTSVRESIDIIGNASTAKVVGLVIALDRMEKGISSAQSAVENVKQQYGISVTSIANLNDIVSVLEDSKNTVLGEDFVQYQIKLDAYRRQYGVGHVK